MSMASKFNVGDLVWAKMKGFSPWPGKIVNPTKEVKRPTIKKPMHCVFFYGTNNYAWILEDQIKPYEQYKEEHMKKNKSSSFKEAVEAIEDYIHNKPETIKTSDLPSIEEEIATIFPNGSNRSTTHRDYSRTPFLSKSKVKPDYENDKFNSLLAKPKDIIEKGEKGDQPKKEGKPKKDDSLAFKSTKRPSSENSSGSSNTTAKRFRPTEKNSASTSNATGGVSASPSSAFSSYSPSYSLANSTEAPHLNASPSKRLLMRPSYIARPVTPPLDVERVSETLKQKNVKASQLKFGFLGLGIMGQGIVKNLLNSGHHVTVWNRTPSKCRDFVKVGAVKGQTPADVVAASDVTFCCVSDPQAAKEMVFGNCGVLQEIRSNKGYVEMTSIDPETAKDIQEAITARGGRFLEAPVSGSKKPAEEGTLIILAAGDRTLFDDCATSFQAMGKHAFFLGEVGNGSKMNLIVNMILGSVLAGLAEAMALADRTGLSQKDLLEVLSLGSLNCPAIIEKGQDIIDGTFPTNMPLQHMQKDLRLALSIGDQLEQPLPITATANEVFKHAKYLGYGGHDVSAVYIRARF